MKRWNVIKPVMILAIGIGLVGCEYELEDGIYSSTLDGEATYLSGAQVDLMAHIQSKSLLYDDNRGPVPDLYLLELCDDPNYPPMFGGCVEGIPVEVRNNELQSSWSGYLESEVTTTAGTCIFEGYPELFMTGDLSSSSTFEFHITFELEPYVAYSYEERCEGIEFPYPVSFSADGVASLIQE